MPESLQRTELDSRLRVLSERLTGARSVSLGIWVDAGSRDENPEQRGLTHFLEHLLFKGTRRLNARQVAEAFDFMGADINAATGREHIHIYSRAIAEHLPRIIEITLDMVSSPRLDPVEIDLERNVILEEIALHKDSPDELVHDCLMKAMWGDHPLGQPVLGSEGVIKSVCVEDIRGFFSHRFHASRVVVAAVGDVDHEKLCSLVERHSEGLARRVRASREVLVQGPMTGNVAVCKDTDQVHLAIGAKGLPRNHPDRFALSVMDNILGGSMSSRLFQRVREDMGLAYAVYSFSAMFIGAGMVGVYCGANPGKAREVIEVIEEELVKAREGTFSEEEIRRAKNQIKGTLVISMEDSAHRMAKIARAELAGGEHLTVDEMLERVEEVEGEDLLRVYEETWGSGGASLAVVGPFEDGELMLSGRI